MEVEIWNPGNEGGLPTMVRSWQTIDTGRLKIKIVNRDPKYIKGLHALTNTKHIYTRAFRTIIKTNGKYIFLDANDRSELSAESWKLPFDLIIKFQHHSKKKFYRRAIAPVSPYTYTLKVYDKKFIHKYRKLRRQIVASRQFASSMFWAGKIGTNPTPRTMVRKFLRKKMKLAAWKRVSFERYYETLATTQVGVVVAGMGDFTHREMELSSIGTPFVRKTFYNRFRNPMVPGIHYYSIGGHEVGIRKTLRHFKQYFEPGGEYRQFTDEEWEEYCEIGHKSLEWYEENGSPQGTFNLFLEILEEQNVI